MRGWRRRRGVPGEALEAVIDDEGTATALVVGLEGVGVGLGALGDGLGVRRTERTGQTCEGAELRGGGGIGGEEGIAFAAEGGDAGRDPVCEGVARLAEEGAQSGVVQGVGGVLEVVEGLAEDALGVVGIDVVRAAGASAEAADGNVPSLEGGPMAVLRVKALGDDGEGTEAVALEGVAGGLEAGLDGGWRATLAESLAGLWVGFAEVAVKGAGIGQEQVGVVVGEAGGVEGVQGATESGPVAGGDGALEVGEVLEEGPLAGEGVAVGGELRGEVDV